VNTLVPAFVAPAVRAVDADLRVACGPGPSCRVTLANHGTVRVQPTGGHLVAVARDGRRSEIALDGWWVLAGGARVHGIELPFPACDARELTATFRVGTTDLVARAEGCVP